MSSILFTAKLGAPSVLKPVLTAAMGFQQLAFLLLVFLLEYPGKKGDAYNILWALVFGFATLNILGLVARRFEPQRTRMSFGEVLAIMVVIVSIFLLGWEFMNLLHIFPIQLKPR
jgi:hypothetical protein